MKEGDECIVQIKFETLYSVFNTKFTYNYKKAFMEHGTSNKVLI